MEKKNEVEVFTRDIRSRIGKFRISRALMESSLFNRMSKFLSNFIIVRCEFLYDSTDGFEYLAISPLFDEVEEGAVAPTYLPSIDENGKIVEMKRLD